MIHISQGNTKLVGVQNISLRPVLDCANSRLCRSKCYALKAFRFYPPARGAWEENSALAHKDMNRYFKEISEYLHKKGTAFFRWHVAGDILNQRYLEGMKDVARALPNIHFLSYTKRFDLSYKGRPRNLMIRFSRWPGDRRVKRVYGIPMSWVQDGTETRIPSSAKACNQKCGPCTRCWVDHLDIWFYSH